METSYMLIVWSAFSKAAALGRRVFHEDKIGAEFAPKTRYMKMPGQGLFDKINIAVHIVILKLEEKVWDTSSFFQNRKSLSRPSASRMAAWIGH